MAIRPRKGESRTILMRQRGGEGGGGIACRFLYIISSSTVPIAWHAPQVLPLESK